jgi:hypothetical protein
MCIHCDNKKDSIFASLRDSLRDKRQLYRENPSIASTCVLQPILLHLYQTSSLRPSVCPIVASANLRLLHSLLYSEHINYTQILGLRERDFINPNNCSGWMDFCFSSISFLSESWGLFEISTFLFLAYKNPIFCSK